MRFLELLALAAVMGLSIFASLPIVLRRSRTARLVNFLSAVAIGILLFILADVWSDVASVLYPGGSYLANPSLSVIFFVGLVFAYFALYAFEHGPRVLKGNASAPKELSATSTALFVAVAIGFQNLTEGMVFGANWAVGLSGVLAVIFVGFFLQNITEGFPIAGPLLRTEERRVGLFAAYFALGGLPTLLGAGIGYIWTSTSLLVLFDAMAIGTCLYIILPMLRSAFRPAEGPMETALKYRLLYFGVGVGFVLGFVVNAL